MRLGGQFWVGILAQIEETEGGNAPAAPDELSYRLGQQKNLADFGAEALRSPDPSFMLNSAARLAATGMQTKLAKVLRYSDEDRNLLIVAGVGWKPGIVGETALGADAGSPAGYAFQTGEAVISNHLDQEDTFRTPDFMRDHGVKRAINILIQVRGKSWGVLEVDSTKPGRFGSADLEFMKGFANMIGVAIERANVEEELRAARKHQELLTREASHRVKNSLAMVSSMLGLQSSRQFDPDTAAILANAQHRIGTIATAHDLLWKGGSVGMIDLADIIPRLCETLDQTETLHTVACNMQPRSVEADRAIPLGLLVNELVTNAMKYAYGDGGGLIEVTGRITDGEYAVIVRDEGIGFSKDFETSKSSGLGLRLVRSLGSQLGANISFSGPGKGGTVEIAFPLSSGPSISQ